MSRSHNRRLIGLPLNPGECEKERVERILDLPRATGISPGSREEGSGVT